MILYLITWNLKCLIGIAEQIRHHCFLENKHGGHDARVVLRETERDAKIYQEIVVRIFVYSQAELNGFAEVELLKLAWKIRLIKIFQLKVWYYISKQIAGNINKIAMGRGFGFD